MNGGGRERDWVTMGSQLRGVSSGVVGVLVGAIQRIGYGLTAARSV